MKKLIFIVLGAMGFAIALTVAGVIGFFLFFERAEKPLSTAQVEQRLAKAGFQIEPQNKLLLYADQEALLPEKPASIQTLRLSHSDGDSFSVTAASFSNEKISHSLNKKTNGFSSRNWFFFGIVNNAMIKKIQDALKAGETDMAYRRKLPDAEPKPLVSSEPKDKSSAPIPVSKKSEEVLTRKEVLERFKAAGLTINRIEEDKGMPGSVKRKLPVEPLDDFLLFIEEEGVFPIEFKTPDDAIAMERNHKKGFRHGNWYFPGQITAELRTKLVTALQNN